MLKHFYSSNFIGSLDTRIETKILLNDIYDNKISYNWTILKNKIALYVASNDSYRITIALEVIAYLEEILHRAFTGELMGPVENLSANQVNIVRPLGALDTLLKLALFIH